MERIQVVELIESDPVAAVDLMMSLLARVEELERQIGRSSRNSSLPPSRDSPQQRQERPKKKGSGRKRGGQPGHPGSTRELVKDPDEVVEHWRAACDGCGVALGRGTPVGDAVSHQVNELVVSVKVTEHRRMRVRCDCGRCVLGELAPGVPSGAFGPGVAAAASTLTAARVSRRETARLLEDLLGVKLSVAAQALIGGDPEGIIVTDRYGVYEYLSLDQRQLCLCHILLSFIELGERDGAPGKLGRKLTETLTRLFKTTNHPDRDRGDLPQLRADTATDRDKIRQLLEQGSRCRDPKARRFCEGLLKHERAFWTFTLVPGVPATNNAAERSLRGPVLWRTDLRRHPHLQRRPARRAAAEHARNLPAARTTAAHLPRLRDHRAPTPPAGAHPTTDLRPPERVRRGTGEPGLWRGMHLLDAQLAKVQSPRFSSGPGSEVECGRSPRAEVSAFTQAWGGGFSIQEVGFRRSHPHEMPRSPRELVVVIDEDLGIDISADGTAERSRFQRLTAEVALGHAGLEVSRMARNNSDWYRLAA